jgi:hypothetical protein
MSAVTELHIIVPGICGPLAETQSLHENNTIKDWVKRLSKAKCQVASASFYDVISDIFGFDKKSDFPAAMFELSATGEYQSDLSYMCADPVHLQADMDHAILSAGEDISISDDESAELCDLLDRHFSQDGIRFIYRDRCSWLLSSTSDITLSTTPLFDAVGRNVNFLLPQGDSSAYWKQVLTEAQMLLFSHHINADREQRGLPSINSLWLYGSGKLSTASACGVSSVAGDDDMLRGLASHVQCRYFNLPDSAAVYMESLRKKAGPGTELNEDTSIGDGSVNVLLLSDLLQLTNYADISLWSKHLEGILNGWIYPLLMLAKKQKVSIFLYPCNGKRYRFSRYDDLRFWRKDKIEQHISSY